MGLGDLGEIDRIEVLEGPQGELFGKNNNAGVINVVTKRPSNIFGVTAEVTGGIVRSPPRSLDPWEIFLRHDSMSRTRSATAS